MQILQTTGLILKVIDFGDYDQIMTVLTPDRGLVKWIYKKKNPRSNQTNPKISPLTHAEFTYTETKGEIWKCRELCITHYNLKLRENYSWLEMAAQFIQWVLEILPSHKPAHKLYIQLMTYLEKIPLISNLKALELSFLMQILRNEGLLNLDLQCSFCYHSIECLSIFHGEHFCAQHAPKDSLHFNTSETLAWLQIAASQTFSQLQSIDVPPTLPVKAQILLKTVL